MREEKIIKFFKLAQFQAKLFSKDPSTQVCSLFIAPESLQIISAGYNGLPRNIKEHSYRWTRPEKYKYVVHAETNGIFNACRNGVSLKDSICFITMYPCSNCSKGLIQVGVKEIYTIKPDFEHHKYGEDFKYSKEMLEESNIKVFYIDIDVDIS